MAKSRRPGNDGSDAEPPRRLRRRRGEIPAGQFPFEGEIEFPLTVELFGFTEHLKARIVYEAQPEFEYCDLLAKQLVPAEENSLNYSYYLQALIPSDRPSGRSTWEDWTIELPNKVWDAVVDAIEEDCHRQDRERRERLGLKPAS